MLALLAALRPQRTLLPIVAVALGVCSAAAQSADKSQESPTALKPAQGVADRMYDALASDNAREPDAATTYIRGVGGRAVVAKVIAEIGGKRMIKLPTGEFDIVSRSDTRPCDRPFASASRTQIAAKLKEDGFEKFKIVPSGYFLFAYDSSEAYFLHTRSILESMLTGVIAQLREWGLEPKRPETPMVVLILSNRAKFDAIQKMPPEVAAYYSQISNRVVLYEDRRLREAAPEFEFKQAAYTIAHEGIHQLLANTGIQQRLARWPQWVSEGLPEYFCPMKVNNKLITTDDSQLPDRTLTWRRAGEVNDLRMYQLFGYRPSRGELIRTVVGARSLTSDGYAVSWGLVHYLAKRKPKEFGEYLLDVSKNKPLQKTAYRGADPLFVKHFGEDYEILETKIQRHLLDKKIQKSYRDPIQYQTHYVMKQIIKRGRTFTTTVALTLSPAEAKEWRDKRLQLAEAEGRDSAFYTIVCKTRKEANYHLGKLGFRVAE